ncbi:hypothetical protein RY27_07130, partial [Litorilinea aerophila]
MKPFLWWAMGAILALTAVLSGHPLSVAAQQPDEVETATSDLLPIFALPGTLQLAPGQPFETYLITADDSAYGLVGETAAVDAQIMALRARGPGLLVKVWGTLYPAGRLSD